MCFDGGTVTLRAPQPDPTARTAFAYTWFRDGQPLNAQLADSLIVSQPGRYWATVRDLPLEASGEQLALTLVSMGNPHAVHFIDGSPDAFELERIGPVVEHDPLFAHRTNFEVVRVQDRTHLDMRVWERGAGITLACGTGACAAVVAARLAGRVDNDVEVALPGGVLRISWDGDGSVFLEGPAQRVFEAVWEGSDEQA